MRHHANTKTRTMGGTCPNKRRRSGRGKVKKRKKLDVRYRKRGGISDRVFLSPVPIKKETSERVPLKGNRPIKATSIPFDVKSVSKKGVRKGCFGWPEKFGGKKGQSPGKE